MNDTVWHDCLNAHGERVQYVGDITLNLDYWDCDCEHHYIHRVEKNECDVCGQIQEDGPSSRECEVEKYRRNIK